MELEIDNLEARIRSLRSPPHRPHNLTIQAFTTYAYIHEHGYETDTMLVPSGWCVAYAEAAQEATCGRISIKD